MAAAGTALDMVSDWLGVAVGADFDGARQVAAGLPTSVVERLQERGLTRAEVFGLVLPLRTWKHRRARREALSAPESERAWRIAWLLALAGQVLGGRDAALAWMRAPKRRFQGAAPLGLLITEPGGRLVEQMLVQLDEGMFA